jgi:hypothetical protein
MPHPKLSETQIWELTSCVAAYISEQRKSFHSKAVPIEQSHKAALQRFFPAPLLDGVRVARGRASEPSFYRQLKSLGITNAPPFSEMAGITFQDVVVHAEPLTHSLLFHELVHAVQYSHLGLRGFAEHYVRGFLSGGSYEQIPLEKQAYELEGRFARNPAEPFSVDTDVQRRLKLRRL